MGIRETFRLALRAIRRNKVRSALTMLGVIIGVASVIAMIALGSGARAVIDEQIQSQGTTLIYLSSGSFGGPGPGPRGLGLDRHPDPGGRGGDRPRGPDHRPVDPRRPRPRPGHRRQQQLEHARSRAATRTTWPCATWRSPRARTSPPATCSSRTRSASSGATVAKTLFPDEDPVGQVIRVRNMPFRVARRPRGEGPGPVGPGPGRLRASRPGPPIQKKLLGINYIHQVSFTAQIERARRAHRGRHHAPHARAPPHPEPREGRLHRAHGRGDGRDPRADGLRR